MEATVPVSVRLNPEQRAKLDDLAARTHRSTSEVLRLLVEGAEVHPTPDIRAPLILQGHDSAPKLAAVAG